MNYDKRKLGLKLYRRSLTLLNRNGELVKKILSCKKKRGTTFFFHFSTCKVLFGFYSNKLNKYVKESHGKILRYKNKRVTIFIIFSTQSFDLIKVSCVKESHGNLMTSSVKKERELYKD